MAKMSGAPANLMRPTDVSYSEYKGVAINKV
jgi:hypothetical protein